MKYLSNLFLGAAIFAGCTALEKAEDKTVSEILYVDAYESNNDARSATPIKIGLPVKARIQSVSDIDFYSFSVPDSFKQGGYVITHLAPFPGRPELSFFNELKQSYGAGNYNSTQGADLSSWISVAPGKTYYASVNDWTNQANDNPYTLQLEFVPVFDSLEPNNKWNEAATIALDSTYRALLFHPGSNDEKDIYDHYKVTLADSGRIQVALTQFPIEMAPEFTILDANGEQLDNFYSSTYGSDLIESSDLVKPGVYIIQVTYWVGRPELGGEGSKLPEPGTKPYRIKVSALPKTEI